MKATRSRAIRQALPADAAAIARVHCQSHAEAYRPLFGPDYVAPGEAQRRVHWLKRLEAGDTLYVALVENEVVGFTHALVEADGRAVMTTLYLLKAFHRHGIGQELMAMLLNHLHGSGHAEVTFDCLRDNSAAIAFYQAQGAREIGRHGTSPREEIRFAVATRPFSF